MRFDYGETFKEQKGVSMAGKIPEIANEVTEPVAFFNT